jgi:integrase
MKKHRGRNEGSITQRKDGRWSAIVSLGWADGKRQRKTIYGRTRAAVADELTTLLGERKAGLTLQSRDATIEQYLEQWLENVRNSIRPRTFEKFESVVRLHIVPDLGKTRLVRLMPDAVQALLNRKVDAGASPQSVRHIRMVLGLALKQALASGVLVRNVAALTKGPTFDPPAIHPMSSDAAKAFLASLEKARLGSLYVLAFASAMRRGELCGLRWNDVNLETRELHVRQSLQRVGSREKAKAKQQERARNAANIADGSNQPDVTGLPRRVAAEVVGSRLQLLPLKTKSSIRTITLPERAIVALKRQRVRQKEERLAAGTDWQGNPDNLVFTSLRGTPIEPRNVYRQFQVLLENAGLPRRRFHDIRHTAATLLFENGASAKQVQALLGHSRVGTTLDTYTHVTPATLDDTAARIDSILR